MHNCKCLQHGRYMLDPSGLGAQAFSVSDNHHGASSYPSRASPSTGLYQPDPSLSQTLVVQSPVCLSNVGQDPTGSNGGGLYLNGDSPPPGAEHTYHVTAETANQQLAGDASRHLARKIDAVANANVADEAEGDEVDDEDDDDDDDQDHGISQKRARLL